MTAPPHAIILAAGQGRRFLESGGSVYKQLYPFRGEPVIKRLVRQVAETGAFSGVNIVLGDDEVCAAAIRAELADDDVKFVTNTDSARDNNLLSFLHGTANVQAGALVIEADCVIETADLAGMVVDTEPDEIRWSNVGSLDHYTYGGVVELDSVSEAALGVSVFDQAQYADFVQSSRKGVKLFGLTFFGPAALSRYRSFALQLSDPYGKYFHHIAELSGGAFRHTTRAMSDACFSFNTISEVGS